MAYRGYWRTLGEGEKFSSDLLKEARTNISSSGSVYQITERGPLVAHMEYRYWGAEASLLRIKITV